ncbi:hypothetical protein COCNU_scaffold002240G000010 [Cocos nucifera]|nr:hypothetical protein [Cocos nucifera]
MPTPKPATTIPSPTISKEVAPSTFLQLEEAIEKKKKRTINKKVVQSLMKESIFLHIMAKMLQRGDVERFDKSYAAYLELGHYLFAHSEAVDQKQAEASKALKEARAEAKMARAKVESIRVALKIQSTKVEHLREEWRVEREKTMKLRIALAQEREEKGKAQEGVDAAVEEAIESFKSSRDMEDIKIAFAQEAFIEGFQIYLGRVAKNFSKVDLDLLMKESDDRADPSSLRVGVILTDVPSSSIVGAILEAPKLVIAMPEPAHGSDTNEDASTSPMVELPEV